MGNRMEVASSSRFNFSLRDIFLLMLVVALATAWWRDHLQLVQLQNTAKTAPRYLSKLTERAIKPGKTKEEIHAALGPAHDEETYKGETYWVYIYDEEPLHQVRIKWDVNDRVMEKVEYRAH